MGNSLSASCRLAESKGGAAAGEPSEPAHDLADALLWAIGSGVALAVARLVAQRGAAEAWHVATGSYPTEVVESGSAA